MTALKIYTSALPRPLYELLEEHWFKGLLRTVGLGGFIGDATIEIGPIPKGTPINLLSNFNLDLKDPRVDVTQMAKLLVEIKQRLKEIHQRQLGEQQATEILKELVPQLIKRSACPDFVVDRGHYFGRDLPDADKEALIEFVKTF